MFGLRELKKGLHLGAVAIVLTLSFGGGAHAQQASISAEKRAAIEALMEVTKTRDLLDQMIPEMVASLKNIIVAQNPGRDGDITAILLDHLSEVFMQNQDEFFELQYVIYDRHLSLEDLRAITEFYQTPAGQNLVAAMPSISRESMQASMAFGQQLALEAVEKARAAFEEEGIELPI